jgi:DNA-binding Lrp family transcriptional regulator
MRAYVFITTQGDARPIVEKIRAIKGVKEADAIWGPSDIIALVEADDAKALIDLVPVKIRKIPGVNSTDTRIAL